MGDDDYVADLSDEQVATIERIKIHLRERLSMSDLADIKAILMIDKHSRIRLIRIVNMVMESLL